ncbi:molybdenum cofactor biosynthesis protein MoaC [Flavobacterium akiainvivens]|uniref:Molybdopterin adenylyltransferase n=1 Tax=Flavobacterium akiainvivens TaxID=1202724 RepID=A0A0M8MBC7_9FLAO|nr:bifunctional molybdenum cofactor biosynthesis protein MoaC/MoaB [Flavobacterium akiainvivens]KOS05134.1 molybdenum cofactor biosynthesis protein MoaC [Flavobacterium akiainvivens]SFQ51307.1 cyclic pyranopterin monophosphate synthase subunit MoaC [Flavobacterium akiainvivens]
MVNITHKTNTLRKAIATATVLTSKQETIDAIEQRKVPKGDIFEFARAAALFGIKKTSDVIPDCHPLPVEYAHISYTIDGLAVIISVEVHTIYKTGVEVEAMHGASVAALVMYDMLKPIDKNVEIQNIRLQEKHGGKSDLKNLPKGLKCAVVVCSDTVSRGEKEDTAGKAIVDILGAYGYENVAYQVVPDDIGTITNVLHHFIDSKTDLVLFTGGTGLSPRDVTPEAVCPFIDTEIPGIMEASRAYGQDRVKTAMLSRGVAGFAKDTLVITLPGSRKGVEESLQAIFPQVLHVFAVREGKQH